MLSPHKPKYSLTLIVVLETMVNHQILQLLSFKKQENFKLDCFSLEINADGDEVTDGSMDKALNASMHNCEYLHELN